MPRAYIETILSSKPGNRRWYLAISCGSKVDRRSRGTSRSILPVSVTTVLRPSPLRLLPSSSPPRWWSISAFNARSASAFFSPSSRPFGSKAVLGSAPASSWSRIASGIRGSLRLGMSGLLRSYHARPHTKFPTGPLPAGTTAYRDQPCLWPAGPLPRQLRPGTVWNAPWVAIDARLEDGRLVGGTHLATVDVHTPGSPHPLTFQECYGFDFPLRWVTRLDCVSADRQPKVIERRRRPLESTRMRLLAAITRSWGKRRGQTLSRDEGDTKPEKDRAIGELAEYRERLAEDPLTYATVLLQVPAATRAEA